MTGRRLWGRCLWGRCLLGGWGRSDADLGAAVTGLPTGPLRWAPVAPPVRVGPQVVLGFRDGSEAVLDPGSAQARALEGIALTLTARD